MIFKVELLPFALATLHNVDQFGLVNSWGKIGDSNPI